MNVLCIPYRIVYIVFRTLSRYLLAANGAADYTLGFLCLCVCVIKFGSKMSKNYSVDLQKIIADTPYILFWKWLTTGAGHIEDSHFSFNHIIAVVDHGAC